jgi:hypothetical protein
VLFHLLKQHCDAIWLNVSLDEKEFAIETEKITDGTDDLRLKPKLRWGDVVLRHHRLATEGPC